MNGKTIAIASPGQPSLNPRLVKEADALCEAGFNVVVFYCYWNDWGTLADQSLIHQKKWQAVRVGGHPAEDRARYFVSRVVHKIARIAYRISGSASLADIAVARGSYFLSRALRRFAADLYIGHNLGALPAVVGAAQKRRKPCGFDAEDFYRYDETDDDECWEVRLKIDVEKRYLQRLRYLTAASPGIASAYQGLFPGVQTVTVLNVFSFQPDLEPVPRPSRDRIKLFWFSQTLGKGRGLEVILEALNAPGMDVFEFHLLGACDPDFKTELQEHNGKIFLHDPITPGDLPAFTAQFDIGFASEIPQPLNRDICLTNKIFTYMQAGLAILASDTSAQKELLAQYPQIGALYGFEQPAMLTRILLQYARSPESIDLARSASYKLSATRFNWKQESRTFIDLIDQTLQEIE